MRYIRCEAPELMDDDGFKGLSTDRIPYYYSVADTVGNIEPLTVIYKFIPAAENCSLPGYMSVTVTLDIYTLHLCVDDTMQAKATAKIDRG